MRWNKTVANDILVTLDAFQIVSGFGTPALEDTTTPIDYAGQGWIPHLRTMLRKINGGVWLEKAWRPSKQRQYDSPIMETFAQHPSITPMMLVLANELRMWWGVIYTEGISQRRESETIVIGELHQLRG
jgi:hypothetical protein